MPTAPFIHDGAIGMRDLDVMLLSTAVCQLDHSNVGIRQAVAGPMLHYVAAAWDPFHKHGGNMGYRRKNCQNARKNRRQQQLNQLTKHQAPAGSVAVNEFMEVDECRFQASIDKTMDESDIEDSSTCTSPVSNCKTTIVENACLNENPPVPCSSATIQDHANKNLNENIQDDDEEDLYDGCDVPESDERHAVNAISTSPRYSNSDGVHHNSRYSHEDDCEPSTSTGLVSNPRTPDSETERDTSEEGAHGGEACESQERRQKSWQNWSKCEKEELRDKIQERLEQLMSETTCKVCLSSEVSRAFRPCGHLCCCSACAKQMKDCPMCRQPVQGSVVVVLPKPRRKTLPMDFDLFLQKHGYFGM